MAKLKYSKSQIEKLFVDVYNGEVDPANLPEDLYLSLAEFFLSGVKEGFGGNVIFGDADEKLTKALTENIYYFSAAKTFQQTLEMSESLVNEEGKIRPFDEFKNVANEIYVKYNGGEIDEEIKPGWLEAEYNTALSQAGHAKKWDDIQKQKEILPYLIRNEIDDSAECDICAAVNGVCLPVDHPFWIENGGDIHYNCRGIVEQAEQEEGEDKEWSDADVDEATTKSNEAGRDDSFKFNPGHAQEIFSTEGKSQHPYFSVSKEYVKFAEENFNLPLK